jgi:hypothetical protein
MKTSTKDGYEWIKPAYVFMDGPFPDEDEDGGEIPSWGISLMTEEDIEIKTFTSHCFKGAVSTANRLGDHYRIPVQIDGTPA